MENPNENDVKGLQFGVEITRGAGVRAILEETTVGVTRSRCEG